MSYSKKIRAGYCPICYEKIEYEKDSLEFDEDDKLFFCWHCPHCGASGTEHYTLEFSQQIVYKPDEPNDEYYDAGDEIIYNDKGEPIDYISK